ncbi:hypothetical protein CK503_13485 [Aliifodinibius salipaludis]|uniref:Glycosyl transferase family 1 domain-containing protein n=1 Tax=Fodinibius salipaludis TaxID=2032627 RepID=A0A2A2G5X5_9BACT|nr:glycosyltransferase family 1 protein [Aliifodinibius salipaludis]PAU93166.1 hypothetical protein CK503_13485 [Aliifodinibius salipaludis]
MKKLVIDASNIISGGGLTHLREFIKHTEPLKYNFVQVLLWAPKKTLDKLPGKEWLNKKSHRFLNKGYLHRFLWRQFVLKPSLDEDTLLFIPGTGYVSGAGKVVTMCRNLLPLEMEEVNRYFFSRAWIRVVILRFLHIQAYTKADGVIFLNEYCEKVTKKLIEDGKNTSAIIPHGVNTNFFFFRNEYKINNTFNLLYVSSLDLYKHQWKVAEAVAQLNNDGYDITLTLIGHSYNGTEEKLNKVIGDYPILSDKLDWKGAVDYEALPKYYKKNDAFIYASTCETFGMTLLEAMASSLPIACSNKSSMEEMLKDAGIYFDPLSIEETKEAIMKLMNNRNLRERLGTKACRLAQNYDWERCSKKTLQFLETVA